MNFNDCNNGCNSSCTRQLENFQYTGCPTPGYNPTLPNVYPVCKPEGQFWDYDYCNPMLSKGINFYVEKEPMDFIARQKYDALVDTLPQGLPYCVRVKVWSDSFPSTEYLGEMVSYVAYTGHSYCEGQTEEVFSFAEDFNMNEVPWDLVVV